jgi:para-nitrobenzyl esterase
MPGFLFSDWRSALIVSVVLLAACAPREPAAPAPAAPAPTEVRIDSGALRGTVVDGVQVFKGIPFAAPPVGEWRWRPPQPVTPWDGVRAAQDYAPFCVQPESALLWFELTRTSEDCLMLNVWTPDVASTEKLPVMVWIHGGGYSQGTGNIPRLNSSALAKQGVVLVTVNYRLAILGFMVHPAVTATHPDEPAGNYGLMDTVASLEWVQRNIAAFGGDPENVTIFGESAGAGIVNYLMVMPSADGLFHRASSQSSSVGMAPEAYIDRQAGFQKAGEKVAVEFVSKAGLDDSEDLAAALREMPVDELVGLMGERDRFTPVVEGRLVPDQPGVLFAQGKQQNVPYITGGVSWEASLGRSIGGGFSPEFAAKLVPAADKERLYPGLTGTGLEDAIFGDLIVLSHSRYMANQMRQLGSPVYSFFMSYVAEDRRDRQPGVAHADDIAFVMNTLDAEGDLEVITESDRATSDLMSAYWVQFAKSGNPNKEGLPEWPAYQADTARVLEIGDEVIIRDEFLAERMAYHMERGKALLERSR